MKSEVAAIRQQILDEYAAAYAALHSFAVVGKHEVVSKHMDRAGQASEKLIAALGTDAAVPLIVEAMEQSKH